MSITNEGITLSPKMLLGLAGLAFAAGGSYYILKDTPKDISALAVEHRAFEKVAHEVHHDLEEKDSKHDVQLIEIRTNQTHMMTGIDDIKTILKKQR